MYRIASVLLITLMACGSRPPAPPTTAATPGAPPDGAGVPAGSAAEASAPAGPTAPAATGVPSACASADSPVCVPDFAFVKRMCNGSFPDVALLLMAKDTPFTRMFMKGDVDGWNADGGASARARLRFDEEMLVLRRRSPPAGGIVVGSGGAGYLVMRWDGNCYTLEDTELTTKKPAGVAKHASLPWRLYAEKTKAALLGKPKVLGAYQKRGKECKGVVSGEVSKACEQADAALSAAVVAEIRGGATIPTPEHLP